MTRASAPSTAKLTVRPLTPELWPALEDLFGENGACNGCWCMYWRIGSAYRKRPRRQNKAAFRAVVRQGPPPGLLAFDGDLAAGCALRPGGKVAVVVFTTPAGNPFMAQPLQILLRHAGKAPPAPGQPGIFALGMPVYSSGCWPTVALSALSRAPWPFRCGCRPLRRRWQ